MSEVNNFEKSILEKAEKKGKALLSRAEKEHDALYEQGIVDLEKKQLKQTKAQADEMRRKYNDEINEFKKEISLTNLRAQEAIINELYTASLEEMKNWDENKHIAFFNKVLEKYPGQSFEVFFGENTYQLLSDASKKALLNNYPELSFSNETIKNQSGFILRSGRVDYNYLYERLIEVSGEDIAMELSQKLFQDSHLAEVN